MEQSHQGPGQSTRGSPARAVGVGLMLAVGGLVVSQLTAIPAIVFDPTIAQSPADASRLGIAMMMALSFVGFALVGAAYLASTGRGLSYLDLSWPSPRELGYAIGSAVGLYGLLIIISVVSQVIGLPSAGAQAAEIVGNDQTLILIMLLIVFLFNAPAEEFLFRNVIQKRLYSAFTPIGAVIATSIIFVVAHVPTYVMTLDGQIAPIGAMIVPSIVLFLGSVVFGYLYVKTENLVVPTLAHAVFNGVQFGLLYLLIEFDVDDVDTVAGTIVQLIGVV